MDLNCDGNRFTSKHYFLKHYLIDVKDPYSAHPLDQLAKHKIFVVMTNLEQNTKPFALYKTNAWRSHLQILLL